MAIVSASGLAGVGGALNPHSWLTATFGVGTHRHAPASACGMHRDQFYSRALNLLTLSVAACLAACVTRDAAPVGSSAPADSANGTTVAGTVAGNPDAVSFEGWQAETFPLPPDFAPDLPTGVESLRFAPGWRSPDAEGFWSYAFVMWINEPAPDAARIDDLLEKYYNGLMASFAAGTDHDIRATPARVDVARTAPNRYEARMRLIDAFATFEPIDLRVLVESAPETDVRAALRIQVSPQPEEHAIWRSLNAAIADILSRDGAAR